MHVRVHVLFTPKDRDAFRKAMGKLVGCTNKEEPGCLYFKIFEPRDSPNGGRTFWLVEQWQDQAALDKHMQMPYVKEFLATWETIKEKDMEVSFLEPVELL